MSEFEKENIEVGAEEEESTIFSAPVAHDEKVKKPAKLKNILLSVVALVLVAAITVTVILVLPEPEENPDTTETSTVRLMEDSLFDKVTSAELINDNGSVSFSLIEMEVTSAEGTKDIEAVWTIPEIDTTLIDTNETEATVNSLKQIHYTRVVSKDKNDGKDYGFDEPIYQVNFAGEDTLSLIIGARTPDNTGRYATTSKDNSVYFVDELELLDFDKTELDFAISESISPITDADIKNANYLSNGSLVSFDKLVVYNKNLGMEYTINPSVVDNVNTFFAFEITSPERRAAGDDGVSALMGIFTSGFTSNGCYSFTTSEYDIKRFGLDKPDFYATFYVEDIVKWIKATLQDDGNYAVITSDTKTIIKLSADSLTPAAFTKKDLCNSFLFIEGVTTLRNLTIQSSGNTVSFDLTVETDEENDNTNLEKVFVGGKEIDVDNFKSFYQFLIGMTPVSYDAADLSGKSPETVITLKHLDGSAPSLIKYYSVGNGRYVVENNGLVMGMISSSNHSYIMKYATNTAADKTFDAK